jgi:hypothetical protein
VPPPLLLPNVPPLNVGGFCIPTTHKKKPHGEPNYQQHFFFVQQTLFTYSRRVTVTREGRIGDALVVVGLHRRRLGRSIGVVDTSALLTWLTASTTTTRETLLSIIQNLFDCNFSLLSILPSRQADDENDENDAAEQCGNDDDGDHPAFETASRARAAAVRIQCHRRILHRAAIRHIW